MEPSPHQPIPSELLQELQAAGRQSHLGQHGDAESICRRLLTAYPDRIEPSVALGVVLHNSGEAAAAIAHFEDHLRRHPGDPSGSYQLGMIRLAQKDPAAALPLLEGAARQNPQSLLLLIAIGTAADQLAQYEQAAHAFEQALALHPTHPVALFNLGIVRRHQRRYLEALTAFDRAIAADKMFVHAHYQQGLMLHQLRRYGDAATAFRHVLTLDPDIVSFHPGIDNPRHSLALALFYLGHVEAAREVSVDAYARHPIFTAPCLAPRPQARVLVLEPNSNHTPLHELVDPKRFERTTCHLFDPRIRPSPHCAPTAIPHDVIWNAVSNAEDDQYFPLVEHAAAASGKALINPPTRIAATRRDLAPRLFADIPDLIVPATRHVARDDLDTYVQALQRPVLVRPVGEHGGESLALISHRDDLHGYRESVAASDFYVTTFHEYRSPDGWYRKYRFAFVDRVPYPYHLALSRDWLVHYWRTDMDSQPWMRLEEEAFLADPRNIFPERAIAAVAAIGEQLDLDYAGLDCGLADDGTVVLFEANATMLIHLNDAAEVTYKRRYVPRIIDAVSDMIVRRAELRAGP